MTRPIRLFASEMSSRAGESPPGWSGFYYDETNNFRRLKAGKALIESPGGTHIASDSLEKNFVIGGVAFATKEAEEATR